MRHRGLILSDGHTYGSIQRTSGAHRIATHLRMQGWDIEVLDFCANLSEYHIKKFLMTRIHRVKFVGFSKIFFNWSEKEEAVAKFIKDFNPDIQIIYGSQVYLNSKSKHIDYHVVGYGENGITALLKYVYSNGEKPKINEVDKNNVIYCNTDYISAPLKNPVIEYEKRDYISEKETLSVETSRGCKFRCSFCNFPFLGVKGDWTRDSKSFDTHLRINYDKFGVTKYSITDETFNDTTEKITRFADIVEDLPFDPYFTGFIRPDLLVRREKDVEELMRMNFIGHFYGIETFNQKSGKLIGKGMDPDILRHRLLDIQNKFIKKFGNKYNATMSMIVGLPEDTKEDIIDHFNWLENVWKSSYMHHVLEIPVKETGNLESTLTKNFEKFGYTVLERDPKREIILEKTEPVSYTFENQVLWKSKYMDIYDAHEMLRYIHKNGRSGIGTNFYMFGPSHKMRAEDVQKYYRKKIDHGFVV